jgi:phage-related protein (TIGR01555 family)
VTALRQDGLLGAAQLASELRGLFGPVLPSATLPSQLYDTDGLAAIIVDRPAEDALASGFVVEGDEEETILNEIDRLDAVQHLTDAERWARLDGAGAVLMLVDDGLTLEQPMDLGRLKQVSDLMSYSVTAISADEERYQDPARRNYGEPVYYKMQPRQGQPFRCHESRLLRVSGAPLASGNSSHTIPWMGRSALAGCYDDLRNYREAMRLSRAILERKQQPVHNMSGLAETLALPDGEGERIIASRLRNVDFTRSLFTTVAVDGLDKFSVLDAAVSGIDALINSFRIGLSASTAMPVPILFGEGLSGLGNSGSGEQGIYHGRLRTIQERSLRPAMEYLISILWAQKAVGRPEPQKWRLVFNPLWSPSEKELAEAESIRATAKKTEAEALVVLGDGQMLTPEESRAYAAKRWPELGIQAEFQSVMPDDDEPPPVS